MKEIYSYFGELLSPANYVTPENFGAVGDGQTDDTNAFLNMLAGGNKIAFLSPKTYKLSGVINVYSNTIIFGNGATFISNRPIFMTGETGNYAYGYQGTKNVIIRDVTLDINYTQTDHIILAHSENILLYNCTLKNNVEHSIELNSSLNVTIENCKFINIAPVDRIPEGRQMEAINIDPAHTGATLNMGYFDDTISDYSKIINCYFENCWCPIGNHNETPYASQNILFIGNEIRNCFRGGQFHSYGNIHIANNKFNVSEIALRFIGANNIKVDSNIFYTDDTTISLESTTENVIITGNIINTENETPILNGTTTTPIIANNLIA